MASTQVDVAMTGGLFDYLKLRRNSDPATSSLSAAGILGQLGWLQHRARRAVHDWPGSTAQELARRLGDGDPRIINRRLNEIEKMGLVRRGQTRKCRVTGRMAVTWEEVK